jgi:D-sedoheptulose 7-phosphate isomerase
VSGLTRSAVAWKESFSPIKRFKTAMMNNKEAQIGLAEITRYFTRLSDHLIGSVVTDKTGQELNLAVAINAILLQARALHSTGNKLIFVGNGGSAAIASHMATDYSKNGNIRSLSLNDSIMITCLANDLGYDRIFAKQIELHARAGDLLIAISSSGQSANILNAVDAARSAQCAVVTFSGFAVDNPLRSRGDLNFYIASDRYGFVEIGHLTLCHAILDFLCGPRLSSEQAEKTPDPMNLTAVEGTSELFSSLTATVTSKAAT